jgi:hypothetical protein
LKARGHKLSVIRKARLRVSSLSRSQCLQYSTKAKQERVPFVVTHNPANPPLRDWLAELHSNMQSTSERMKRAVPLPPVVGERNCRSLRALLMPSVLPTPRDPQPGSFKCENSRCVVCEKHLVESSTFTSDQTGESFHMRHRLSCASPNIIYLLFCIKCNKKQYVGETQNALKVRFYQHRSDINQNRGTLVTEHFNLPDHSLDDLRCMPIEKHFTDSTHRRRKREDFWKAKLRTLTPHGLNVRD